MKGGGVKAIGLEALGVVVGWRLSGRAWHKDCLYGCHWWSMGWRLLG